MIFDFVVRRLHFLAAIPGAPQCFDAALLLWTAVSNRERLTAIELLETEALLMPDVEICSHRFGGIGFAYKKKEFAHVHGNGLLDVELTLAKAAALVESKQAHPHHVLGRSRWVSFWLASEVDVATALEILRISIEARKVSV